MTNIGDPLESLQAKIDTAKSGTNEGKQGKSSAMSRREQNKTAQLASGLAAGAAVGGICGYLIDRWLSTSPIGLILGFFLGFGAGLYNLVSEAGKETEKEDSAK